MDKPSNLLLKLSRRLFDDSTAQEQFIQALTQPQSFPTCIIWCRQKPESLPFAVTTAITWQPAFVDCVSPGEKLGKFPLHEDGYYYCLDFSSVFAASTLLAISEPISTILDMCAAPGGKGIFAWKALQPELLISNEVIGKRLGMLISNLKRCQISPAAVTNIDPQIWSQRLPHTCNLAIVDAPCTGQSLLAKGDKALGCFHPTLIHKNASRQKRILANSAQVVAPQGYLAYMTCTYSIEENEQVCEWFLARFPQFQPVSISHLERYQSHLTTIPCYRLFPQDGMGAGAFTALFQNQENMSQASLNKQLLSLEMLQQQQIVPKFIS
ncbi:RsmB/NOP family class I SAM-dependent RNA methyltransferase [Chroococcidiopsidales cyanobacterium LEGE 13417]|nr:RsmB/NOP family class I SAM-dependent RNA methyltransferase [Chroococcidiopsidales cyanobacterium LEGE 13417]